MLLSRMGSFEDLSVADLFAGSGALGIESLSRGAASATFVDSDPAAIQTIRDNVQRLGAAERVNLMPGSALSLRTGQSFDLIFADPPYGDGAGTSVVQTVAKADWLAPGGWMSVETSSDDEVDPGSFAVEATRRVGRARLTLLRRP